MDGRELEFTIKIHYGFNLLSEEISHLSLEFEAFHVLEPYI